MTRLKAFASHLTISFVIFLVLLAIILFTWYPPPFFNSDGGWQGIRIIVGVDLVIGPLLTLIVFKPGKPGLKFDLTIIGLIQITALSWGIWMVYHERPIATVFTEDYFSTVTAYQLKGLGVNLNSLHQYGKRPPYWIFSDLPTNIDAMQKIRLRAIHMEEPIAVMAKYYRPLNEKAMRHIRQEAINMPNWLSSKPEKLKMYEHFIKKHGTADKLIFLPWHAKERYKVIALNKKSGEYVGELNILPPNEANRIIVRVKHRSQQKPKRPVHKQPPN